MSFEIVKRLLPSLTLAAAFFNCCISAIAQPIFRHYSREHGAPENISVVKIVQDHQGLMWFGTRAGLFSFDSRVFKKYDFDSAKPGSIASSRIEDMICDSRGDLWIAGPRGLSRYSKTSDAFTVFRHDPKKINSLSSDWINTIFEDSRGGLWIGTDKGLDHLIVNGDQVTVARVPLTVGQDRFQVRCLVEAGDHTIWIGTTSGLIHMRADGSRQEKYDAPDANLYPLGNAFYSMCMDKNGQIWLAIRNGGLFRFDSRSHRFDFVKIFEPEQNIAPVITRIIADNKNGFWLATSAGLANHDTLTRQTAWYTNKSDNPNSLPDNALNTVCLDSEGGIWLGSYYSGIDYMNPRAVQFSKLPFTSGAHPDKPYDASRIGKSNKRGLWAVSEDRREITFLRPGPLQKSVWPLPLPAQVTYDVVYLDKEDIVWAGGISMLTSYDLNTGRVTNYPIRRKKGTENEGIVSICEDSRGNLWTCGHFGLFLFDRKKARFKEVFLDDGRSMSSGLKQFTFVMEDSQHNLWAGGVDQLYLRKNGSDVFTRIPFEIGADSSQAAIIRGVKEDPKGRLWIAAGASGLQLYDPALKRATKRYKAMQIPVLEAYEILIDAKGYIWVNNKQGGLLRYHPDSPQTQQYFDARDGLPPLKLNVYFQDTNGTMAWGTRKGIFQFNPADIQIHQQAKPVVISSLILFNKRVEIGDETGILQQPLGTAQRIVFRHDQNIFTLNFASLNFARPDKNQYAYMLEGFEKQWNYVSIPSATYTNLSPGEYTFLVRGSNSDGYWTEHSTKLTIRVLPPWWRTWYAYLAYLMLFAAVLFWVTRFFWLRSLLRKESELYQAKLDFFTNISHEIRTHLTLIGGPLQKVFQAALLDHSSKNLLAYATTNFEKLTDLVDELLEFRKMDAGDIQLHVGQEDLVKELKIAFSAFEHLFREKSIQSNLKFPRDDIHVWYDCSQMQKVYYNLLSNAHKFTPEGGRISIIVEEDDDNVWVSFIDNGRGISNEHLEKIFDNFFQERDQNTPNRGYGIGLALSRKIVERHHGLLTATSMRKDGDNRETCFKIQMLKGNAHFDNSQLSRSFVLPGKEELPGKMPVQPRNRQPVHQQRHTVLLIEDNDELRTFTREVIENTYKVLETSNGLAGLEIARERLPDLIVSDIMMPEMDGLDLCTALKSDIRTCHIPIILLTAKGATHHLIQGLKAGADAYLIKPFDIRVLELKIKNLINARQILSLRSSDALADIGVAALLEMDKQFLTRLRKLVDENISDSGFGVRQISEEVGMSLSLLYRKVKALTGTTVNDFVKSIRMQHAAKLLSMKIYNVNEVAYMVGYEDRKYFSKEFKKVYGQSPSKFVMQVLNESIG